MTTQHQNNTRPEHNDKEPPATGTSTSSLEDLDDHLTTTILKWVAAAKRAAVDITVSTAGWDSAVVIIDGGKTVAKFPRHPDARTGLHREASTLTALETAFPTLDIPRVIEFDDAGPLILHGVVGEPFNWPSEEPGTSHEGACFGELIAAIHSVTPPHDIPTETPTETVTRFQTALTEATPLLDKYTTQERNCVESLFEEPLGRLIGGRNTATVLCHGDAGPWNMISTRSGGISLIDFADSKQSDPVTDFGFWWSPPFIKTAFEAYGADTELRHAAALLSTLRPILDAAWSPDLQGRISAAAHLVSAAARYKS